MKKEMIAKLTKRFEESAHTEQGVEFWMARDSNIFPEDLPPEEDIKKLERRLKNENNNLMSKSDVLPMK